MANYIDENGIHIDSLKDIVSNLITSFQTIYGHVIILDSNTPDGQMINIFAQSKEDTLQMAVNVYNSFNPDLVVGQAQDRLYKLVGLYRNQAKFSFVNVNITVDRALNLSGLDSNIDAEGGAGYTVSDTNGTEFILANSVSLSSAGTYLLEFRAKNSGAVEVAPNSITNMNTVLLGVVSVNNPESQFLTGNSVETDSQFRIRFNKSRSISSQGFNDGLLAQLLAVNNVSQAGVYQNRTNTTDSDGTPAHTIWVIVEGGAVEDIANVIYANLTDGCGMRGETSYTIQKQNGANQIILFDRPISQNLYIQGDLQNLGSTDLDVNTIIQELINNMTFDIYEGASSSDITCALNSIANGSFVPYNIQVSTNNSTWSSYVQPTTKQNYFVLNAANINLTESE